MVAIPLTSGAYSAQSRIANAQRCVNLYCETNPPDTHPPFPFTHYPRPGLLVLGSGPPAPAAGRCLYRATNGNLYAVVGQTIYYIDPNWTFNPIYNLTFPANTPVYFADNGVNAVGVDGSTDGYNIFLASNLVAPITDPSFFGSTRIDFLDSFLVCNIPNTNQWYCTNSDSFAFNALYVGIKTAWPDNILCVVTCEREAWLFGPQKTEVWYNAGTVPFPFQILPGVIIEQGCIAKYSPQKMDTNVYWLSQSPEGARMVMRGNAQNVAQRISTHAIEQEWLGYSTVADAIGSVYQISGHSFYKIHFPTADKTWGYDEATHQWHEDNWIDNNGILHRARNTFMAYAYGVNVGLDWATGQLYQVDPNTFTDNGQPIAWIRSFPHSSNELKYLNHKEFTADVETGTRPGTGKGTQFLRPWSGAFSMAFGPITSVDTPEVMLRCSRDGGYNFGNGRVKNLVSSGRYRSMMRWRANGIARDMVFELSSTAQMCGALNGAYIDPVPATA